MKIELKRFISPLHLEIYEFDVDKFYIEYCGFSKSLRNSESDPWGHEWSEFYRKEIEEINARYEKLVWESDDEEHEYEIRLDWRKELDKYNPCVAHLYSGEFGPAESLKKLPWTKEEVKEMILEEMKNHFKKEKWHIRIN